MADTGDHAYSHALAVVRDPGRAALLAAAAVRHGGRSNTLALAHASRDALASARLEPPEPPDPTTPAPDDLGALAQLLVATRPCEERAVVDLDGRHGLDRVRLGRILGTSADAAAAQVATIATAWQSELDPVLLVRLGPGTCASLAELLGGRGLWSPASDPNTGGDADNSEVGERSDDQPTGPAPAAAPMAGAPVVGVTIGELLAAADAVGSHAAGCAVCSDRLRAIVSVRDLVTGAALQSAPESVRHAARTARFRPAVFPNVELPGGGRLRARAVAVVAVLIGLLLGAGVIALVAAPGDEGGQRVADLARVPASGGGLQVRPPVLRTNPLPAFVLRNEGDDDVRWRIETGVAWLTALPSEGALAAGTGVSIRLSITPEAPEGEVRVSVNVVGDDGSTASLRVETTVEHPPDLDAAATGCSVTAAVEDESEITSVRLHYRAPPGPATRGAGETAPTEAADVGMRESDAGWTATLPSADAPLTWWVTATDARGNVTKGEESVLPAGCTTSTPALPTP